MSMMKEKIMVPVISVISVLIPIAVAVLLYMPKISVGALDLKFLPRLNASINFTVTLLLLGGFYAIRRKYYAVHKTCMLTAFVLSAIFLVSYVLYHASVEETRYGGEGWQRYLYFFFLITHIVLSIFVVPLALFAIYRGINNQNALHKKVVRWAFPIWLYVSITGVIIYWMISPYYN